MPTLAGIRSEIRALMALDDRGEIDQPHRHKALFQILADLQDLEVHETERNMPEDRIARADDAIVKQLARSIALNSKLRTLVDEHVDSGGDIAALGPKIRELLNREIT